MGRIKRCLLKERRNWLKARESFHCRDSIDPSFVMSAEKRKTNPKESNARPSESTLRCSTSEP